MVGMGGRTIRHVCVLLILELLPTPTRADDGREVIAATPTARRLGLLVICIAALRAGRSTFHGDTFGTERDTDIDTRSSALTDDGQTRFAAATK